MAKDTKSQKWLPKQWYKEKAEHATVQLFVKTSEKFKKKSQSIQSQNDFFAILFTVHLWAFNLIFESKCHIKILFTSTAAFCGIPFHFAQGESLIHLTKVLAMLTTVLDFCFLFFYC